MTLITRRQLVFTTAVLSTGRLMTWGEVREFLRPPEMKPLTYGPAPIPLRVDGLDIGLEVA